MHTTLIRVVGLILVVAAAPVLAADEAEVAAGRTIFRASCVRCHGADARGFTGPDLTAAASQRDADVRLPRIIRAGVPGTDMPAAGLLSDTDISFVVAYLRSLGAPASPPAPFALSGVAADGEKLFWGAGGCGTCHRVNGRGGRLGPNLSRGLAVATAPARDAAIAAIRRPSDVITPGYVSLTVVTRDGQRVRGIRKNEDTFSVQMMDTTERLRGFLKSDVREVIVEQQSLMPAYGADRLSDADVDALVRYLVSLREASLRERQ